MLKRFTASFLLGLARISATVAVTHYLSDRSVAAAEPDGE